jgi:MoxR-like ATPase
MSTAIAPVTISTAHVLHKFQTTRKELASSLIERDQEIDLVLTALIAQEHVLFVGPPGTAKSMLADAICDWLHGRKFSMLVTKFSVPEEMFGPISVAGLKTDRYRRITTGKLPDCDVGFLDEIFKGSSAILNTTLRVLNERRFYNDGTDEICPLKLCIAASNEWPGEGEGGKELGALFDRFVLRRSVRPIGTDRGLDRLCWDADLLPKLSTSITPDEIDAASAEAALVPWTTGAKDALIEIRKACKSEGIIPGDRRIRKAVGVCRAFAWLSGATEVETDHLSVLADVLWDDPTEQPRKVNEIVGQIANPSTMAVNGLLMEAEGIINETDSKDLAKTATATKKLNEVVKKLKGMSGTRAEQALDYVQAEIKRIRAAAMEGL